MQGFIDKPILWGLDPLFHVNVKILAKMLKSMMPGNGTGMQDPPVYFYQFNPRAQPRPIRLVAIAGVVVQKQDYRKLTRFIIDDGSDTAHCMYWNSSSREVLGDDACLHLGQFVHLYGKLEWKDRSPTIMTTRILFATGADAELMWWLDVASVHKKVYSAEFEVTIPPEEEANLASQSMSQTR